MKINKFEKGNIRRATRLVVTPARLLVVHKVEPHEPETHYKIIIS